MFNIILFIVKNLFIKFSILYFVFVTLASCSGSKEMINGEDLNIIKTSGIYVAENPYAIMSSKPDKIEPTFKKALFIIRFTSQNEGIIIPHADTITRNFSIEKISEMYQWSYDYEKQNPIDKNFIRFKLQRLGKDTIVIPQTTTGTFIKFQGINYTDSLILNHSLGMTKEQQERNAIENERILKFIFYKYPN